MLRDTTLVLDYQLRRLMRAPFVMVIGVVQPLLWLLLFGPLIQHISGPGLSRDELFNQFAAGLLVLLALYGSLYTGFELISELRAGVVERVLVTPMRPSALIVGKVLRDVLVVLVQAGVLLLISTFMGLRTNLVGLLVTMALFVLTIMLTASFSYATALSLRDENVMSQSLGFLSLPLLLLSGVVLPLSLAPDWLRAVAQVNPFYHVVEAARALMAGDLTATSVPVAFAVTAVLTLLVIRWAVSAMRRV